FYLLGARDHSIIKTPPHNIIPVQTEIIDFEEDVIRDILTSELERGGQIFFIHNKIEDIDGIEDIVRRICPGIKTCVAHGRMEPTEIEKKILNFMAGDYDILISTTIVENGIDIPNANTIIINKAQNFGLSDLHQLRGRVGRSNRKAFCYLIVPPLISVTDDARRRLKAIEAFSDLGSGFNIAMQDLDIRGMGNMLGAEQSGFIADMGFETYQRILAEAFEEIKQDYSKENPDETPQEDLENQCYVNDCAVETDLQLLIPDTYINIQAEKIRLYRELDNISDEEELGRFISSLEDRFGPIPDEVRELCFVVRLRWLAKAKGFEKIVLKNEKLLAYFVGNQMSPYYRTRKFADIINYIQQKPGDRYAFKEQNSKLYLTVNRVRTIEGAYKVMSSL
ncbi:MAG: transcription-repair coupling factor, partial [Bacteroidales bacterium]|nr:transcription-repair coupling factor [Bacteroidales bacterium]